MESALVILAAGIGRRFGGFKQMEPVGPSGEYIIDYSIFDAIQAGFKKTVFLISRDIQDDFTATIGARVEKHIATDYALQDLEDLPAGYALPNNREKPWGTGHAILACRHAVDGPFAVINADDFYGKESFRMLSRFLRDTADAPSQYGMVGFVLRNTVSEYGSVARGICNLGPDGYLEHIVERTKIETSNGRIRFSVGPGQWEPLSGNEIVSMNMWGFKPSFFGFLEREFRRYLDKYGNDPKLEFFAPSVVDKMIVEGEAAVKALETPCSWVGVTYPKDKRAVAERIRGLIDAGEYPANLWGGASA